MPKAGKRGASASPLGRSPKGCAPSLAHALRA
jgi:hypothetical protein